MLSAWKSERWPLVAAGFILLFAFLYTAPLGYHLFDCQGEMLFDAAFRIHAGQVPFRDFYSAVGPFQYWILAGFFRVFGARWFSYILMGCFMNMLGTAAGMRAAWNLTKDTRLTLASALITALWFMPIEAARPTFNNFAYLCLLPAVALLTESSEDVASWRDALAGLLVAVSFYSKQTIGGVGGLFLGLFLLQSGFWRRGLAYGTAAALSVGAFTGWFVYLDKDHEALRQLFVLPLTYRLPWTAQASAPLWFIRSLAVAIAASGFLFLSWYELPVWFVISHFMAKCSFDPRFPLMSIYFFAPLATLYFARSRRDRALTMVLVLMSYLPHHYSVAETYTYCVFMGLQLILFWKAYLDWTDSPARKSWLSELPGPLAGGAEPVFWATFLLVLFNGLRVSLKALTSKVLMFSVVGPAAGIAGFLLAWTFLALARKNAKARTGALAAGLLFAVVGVVGFRQGLRTWRMKHEQVAEGDTLHQKTYQLHTSGLAGLYVTPEEGIPFEKTLRYLQDLPPERRPFFVFPDYSIVYSALAILPPQPYLWFIPGITYVPGPPDDQAVCAALRAHGVKTIMTNEHEVKDIDLPCVREMMEKEYALDQTFELGAHVFRIYKKVSL